MRTIVLAACLSLTACAGLTGAPRPTFDQGAFNDVWYGAYYRPLPGTPHARQPRGNGDAPAAPTPSTDTRIPDANARRYEPVNAAAYVRDVYALNETSVGDANAREVVDIYRHTQEHGQIYHTARPAVGDLVFFHNTFDANGDSRPNDWFSHVGMVESVSADDTVTVLSYVDGAIGRLYMNRSRPDEERDGRDTLNTRLRTAERGDPAHTEYTAAHLFAGFGSLLGERAQVVVLDTWEPSASPSLRASR